MSDPTKPPAAPESTTPYGWLIEYPDERIPIFAKNQPGASFVGGLKVTALYSHPAAPESTPGGAVELVTVPRFLIEWAAKHHDGVVPESVVRALLAALAAAPSPPSQPEAASAGVALDLLTAALLRLEALIGRVDLYGSERASRYASADRDFIARARAALSQTPGQSTQDSVSPSKEKGHAG